MGPDGPLGSREPPAGSRLTASIATSLPSALAVISPGNLKLAAALAQRYIEQARLEGDPRYLGYAESVLGPWWKQAQPPSEILVLRATLRQSTHQFAWAQTLLAEMAARLGAGAAAERWFRKALAFDDADSYLLAACADFLLDQRRPGRGCATLLPIAR
jgi:predicted Zn-dependent protease